MKSLAVLGALLVGVPLAAVGQDNSSSGRWTQKFQPGQQGSRNIKLMSHIPLGGRLTVGDIEAERSYHGRTCTWAGCMARVTTPGFPS